MAFKNLGLTRKVGLLRRMVITRLENCESVEQYVTEIVSAAHQLNSIGLEVKEEWIGTILLRGLLERYGPMIMALENSDIAITRGSIKTKLLQEVKSKEISKPKDTDSNTAFYIKKHSANNSSSSSSKKGPKCYSCNQHGHIAKSCPAKLKEGQNKTEKGSKDQSFLLRKT